MGKNDFNIPNESLYYDYCSSFFFFRKGQKTLFLVPSVPLVDQQTAFIRGKKKSK